MQGEILKPKGYNRNWMGGKRPHKGISRIPLDAPISVRITIEITRYNDYLKRVGQLSYKK